MRRRSDELHRLWELLLAKLADKGMKLQQALVLVQFLRQYDEVMFWIHDKVSQLQESHSQSTHVTMAPSGGANCILKGQAFGNVRTSYSAQAGIFSTTF